MILFRADGNEQIGMGHIMRCLTIADAFQRKGRKCMFVLADESVKNFVEKRGFPTIILNTDFGKLENELEQLIPLICSLETQWIFVDSYYVSETYFKRLSDFCKVAYIDDLAMFAYPVDVLINYNVYAPDIGYKELYVKGNVSFPKTILGSNYAPLRDEFRSIRFREQNPKCMRVLLSTGGADPIHLALEFVNYIIEHSEEDEFEFHVVLGALNPDKDKIKRLASQCENIIIHQNVQNMVELMISCDIAVSAAGSTLYELCACGVPTITYVLADNQLLGDEAFQKLKLMVSLGDVRESKNLPEQIYRAICELNTDFEGRKSKAQRMRNMVDGFGVDRLVSEIGKISGGKLNAAW
jgi:UDP-2,4-diacetamido-2,4,6-trideoxy-beta-L-altropyranose hydrolase